MEKKKDFMRWLPQKQQLNDGSGTALFHKREVWWCVLGVNIGFEQDGGQGDFSRPVVVLKKYNLDACLVVPLTGRPKLGRYYFPIGRIEDRDAVAIVSQIRFIDRKRLLNKICTLDEDIFSDLMQSVIRENLSL